jgi:hypothetical protein
MVLNKLRTLLVAIYLGYGFACFDEIDGVMPATGITWADAEPSGVHELAVEAGPMALSLRSALTLAAVAVRTQFLEDKPPAHHRVRAEHLVERNVPRSLFDIGNARLAGLEPLVQNSGRNPRKVSADRHNKTRNVSAARAELPCPPSCEISQARKRVGAEGPRRLLRTMEKYAGSAIRS